MTSTYVDAGPRRLIVIGTEERFLGKIPVYLLLSAYLFICVIESKAKRDGEQLPDSRGLGRRLILNHLDNMRGLDFCVS